MTNKILSIVTGSLIAGALFAFGMAFALYYTGPVVIINRAVEIKVPIQEPPPAVIHKYDPRKYDM